VVTGLVIRWGAETMARARVMLVMAVMARNVRP
jgi:hypothetical protein